MEYPDCHTHILTRTYGEGVALPLYLYLCNYSRILQMAVSVPSISSACVNIHDFVACPRVFSQFKWGASGRNWTGPGDWWNGVQPTCSSFILFSIAPHTLFINKSFIFYTNCSGSENRKRTKLNMDVDVENSRQLTIVTTKKLQIFSPCCISA